MLAYHRTYHAAAILREGFRDGYYLLPLPNSKLYGSSARSCVAHRSL
jgi:hypothetical protein